MSATQQYRLIQESPLKSIILYYTEVILKDIPKVPLEKVISKIMTGKTPPKSVNKYYASEDINWFKPSDIGYGKFLLEAPNKISNESVDDKKATLYSPETLLLIGIGGGVGRVAVLKESGSSNQQITGLTFHNDVNVEWVYYYFLAREEYIKSKAKSMSFPILNQSRIKELEIRYPLIDEQIKVCQFFDHIQECVSKKLPPSIDEFDISDELKTYARKAFTRNILIKDLNREIEFQNNVIPFLKQAILQEAIQGKFTTDWRKKNPDVESASELLQRIKTEKDRLIKERSIRKGRKQKSNDIGKIKFELPPKWQFVDLDDITQFITDGTHQTPTYTDEGRMFLSAQNVKPFQFMPENHKYISERAFKEYTKGKMPEIGDLLVGRVGSKGETAVIDQNIEFAYYVSVGLVKTFKQWTNSDYLAIVMNSPFGYKYASGNMSSLGASAGNFNLGRIRSFPIPLPPYEEQQEIVNQTNLRLERVNELESTVVSCKTNAQNLIKSILTESLGSNY